MTRPESLENIEKALESFKDLDLLWRKRFARAVDQTKPSDLSTCDALGQSILKALRHHANDILIEYRGKTLTKARLSANIRGFEIDWKSESFPKAIIEFFNIQLDAFDDELIIFSKPCSTGKNIHLHGFDVNIRMDLQPCQPSGCDAIVRILPLMNLETFKHQIEAELLDLSIQNPVTDSTLNRLRV